MAEYLQKVLGGAKSSVAAVSSEVDADFADFATAAAPEAPSHAATPLASATATAAAGLKTFKGSFSNEGLPYTKWYRVWERASLDDFKQELMIIPALFVLILINLWGTRANRSRAKEWAQAHLSLLESEFASVGFSGARSSPDADGQTSSSKVLPEDMMREKTKGEYNLYASGRQNVAHLTVKLSLLPRYNPAKWLTEAAMSFFMESMPAPAERVEATLFCFDGKEKMFLPSSSGGKDSSYDGFVWAVVHKEKMKQLRDDRYDISLTSTKDSPKLPAWATVMSESAEVTDALLTPELIKAVEAAGEDLEALIITDQPIDSPRTLNDTIPHKRVSLSMRLTTSSTPSPLFAHFLRMPDTLVSTAHFRPEATRRIRATREEAQARIRKVDDDEKNEERRLAMDKSKKEERDRKLARMTDGEQKKFLEKERQQSQRKQQKKQTVRG